MKKLFQIAFVLGGLLFTQQAYAASHNGNMNNGDGACPADSKTGKCVCQYCHWTPCHYNTYRTVCEPYTVEKTCCRMVPQYYQVQKCRMVPQYYCETKCRQVPEYYKVQECKTRTKCICEPKCTYKCSYYWKNECQPCAQPACPTCPTCPTQPSCPSNGGGCAGGSCSAR